MELLKGFLESNFMPHGHCFLWRPDLLGLHVSSDLLIGLSYLSIPFAIRFYMHKKEIELKLVPTLFILFIVSCGLTHFLNVWNFWNAHYWISGFVKLFTAIISAITAVFLWKLMPQILKLPTTKELKLLNEELDHQVKKRTKDLQEKNQDLEMLNSFISHDIKTPLNVITGYSEILEDLLKERNDLKEEEEKCLRKIINSGQIISSMVSSLSHYSNIGTDNLEKSKFALIESFSVIKDQFEEDFKSLEVVTLIGHLPEVMGDKVLVAQIFQNLIQNSIKYRDPSRVLQIEISADEDDSFFIINYKDNGQGVSSSDIDKIFNYKFQTSKENDGHGIGLAICKKIMLAHRGKITAKSSEGQGILFSLYFPRN